MRVLFAFLLTLGGVGLTLQSAVNSRLGKTIGSPLSGALISFLVGLVPLVLAVALGIGGRGRLSEAAGQPWWVWIGGLFGAFYVTLAILGVPRVGTAVVVACAVFGQLLAALVLDSQGWFGVPRTPINAWRIAGAVLLLAGVLLMQHKK